MPDIKLLYSIYRNELCHVYTVLNAEHSHSEIHNYLNILKTRMSILGVVIWIKWKLECRSLTRPIFSAKIGLAFVNSDVIKMMLI